MNTYNKYYNNKKDYKKLKKYLSKILIAIIFLLVSIIYIKLSDDNKKFYESLFLENSISFTKINDWYQKYFGNVIPVPTVVEDTPVFNEDLTYKNKENYLNGSLITVSNDYMIPVLQSGIVVFVGEKEGYNKTIIVQGNDGVDIWYGNIDNTNLNLYDYVKKGDLVGNVKDNTLYLVFMKDNNYISYEEYNKN